MIGSGRYCNFSANYSHLLANTDIRLTRVFDGDSLIFRVREDPSTRSDGCYRKRGIGSACVR
jgi:hypothetical protein